MKTEFLLLQLLHLHGACVLMGDFFLPTNFLELKSELSHLVEELRKGQPIIPGTVNQLQLNKKLTSSTFLNDILYSWWSFGKLFIPHLHPNPELKHRQQQLKVGDVCLIYNGFDVYRLGGSGDTWWLCVVLNTIDDSGRSVKVGFRPRRHSGTLLCCELNYCGPANSSSVNFYERKVFIERLALVGPIKEVGGEDAEDEKHEDKLED